MPGKLCECCQVIKQHKQRVHIVNGNIRTTRLFHDFRVTCTQSTYIDHGHLHVVITNIGLPIGTDTGAKTTTLGTIGIVTVIVIDTKFFMVKDALVKPTLMEVEEVLINDVLNTHWDNFELPQCALLEHAHCMANIMSPKNNQSVFCPTGPWHSIPHVGTRRKYLQCIWVQETNYIINNYRKAIFVH
jgi:hypothetical protein